MNFLLLHIIGIASCVLLSVSLLHMTVLPVPLDCAKWLAVDTVILPHRPYLTGTAHTFVLADGSMQANQEYPDASKDECTRNLHSRLERRPLAMGRMLQSEENDIVFCVKKNITKHITHGREVKCSEEGECATPYSDYILCPSQYTASSTREMRNERTHCRYSCKSSRIVAALQLSPSPPCAQEYKPCAGGGVYERCCYPFICYQSHTTERRCVSRETASRSN